MPIKKSSGIKKVLKKTKAKKTMKRPSEASSKPPTKAKATTTTAKRRPPVGVDFKAGSDMATVWGVIKKGGATRREVLQNCRDALKDNLTRNGGEKPVSTIVNHVLRRAEGAGYTVKSSWKLMPPATTDTTKKIKSTKDKKKGLKTRKLRPTSKAA